MKYLGYYDVKESTENRNYTLSAANKMDYIINTINKLGYDVEIISASGTRENKSYKGKTVILNENKKLKLFFTLGRSNKIKNILNYLIMQIEIFFYLLIHIQRGETVLVYHSLGYAKMILLLKYIKKFRLILEVEEIYADVIGNNYQRKIELKLFKQADAYLFPTELLDEKINLMKKTSVIIYGTYQVEEKDENVTNNNELQEKRHLLYAGTFDPRKGCVQAAAVVEYLPSDYHVHILGFGTEEDTKNIQETISEISKKSSATVTYDGLLSGKEYIQFVQKCQVGLSTQSPGAAFNDTSFPSKVLSYLANGLRVVSIRIKALERSAISHLLYYYDEDTPEAIAEVVKKIDFTEAYDSRTVIRQLDKKFTKELGVLFNEINNNI